VQERDLRAEPLEVLIVEDDDTFSMALASFLERDDRIVVLGVARDLATALVEAGRNTVDVALVDVRLGRIDGFGVVEALRQEHPSLVALMMSGMDASEFAQRARAAGADGVLEKTTLARDARDAVIRAYLTAAR
jgi:DNA-binding NarL/FixJ family response regulator